jgi:hypothetical protein
MKKLSALLVALMIMVALFAACGQTEEPTTDDKTSQTTNVTTDTVDKDSQAETVTDDKPLKSEETTKVSTQEEKPVETAKPSEDTTKAAQTVQDKTKTSTGSEKPAFYMDYFDGQFVKCKLPDKWTGQEDLNQGVAAAIINQTQKAGLSIQIVRDNKDSLESRVSATSKSVSGIVDGYSAGKYNYKRITFQQQGKTVSCMICIVGSNAYYVVTDILNDPGIATILDSLELK